MSNQEPDGRNAADRKSDGFRWVFEKMGGIYQVALRRGDDIRNIGQLDPKVWVALSCPASGLEFDQRTLDLIDLDHDGRIRIPEVVNSVEWLASRLKDLSGMIGNPDRLPLAAIDDATEEGRHLAEAARIVLASLGKPDADGLTREDMRVAVEHASEQELNGDGILPPLHSLDDGVRSFIDDALAVVGGVQDASGRAGANLEIGKALVQTLKDLEKWRSSVEAEAKPLGKDSTETWGLIGELGPKIDDYFLRCEMAAYSPVSRTALNAEDKILPASGAGLLDRKSLLDLPLAHVDADRPLNLAAGVNPAWRDKAERLGDLVAPLLTKKGELTREDWKRVREAFAPYAGALASKPAPVQAAVAFPPTAAADSLPPERVKAILETDVFDRFAKICSDDADMPAAASDIAAVEKLVLYYLNLHRLLVNYVSFEDFYSLRHSASFQSGTLYIDGRACHLCMPAEKADDHATLAAQSQLFLLYCRCSKGVKPGTKEPSATKGIVAAVTAGESDLLIMGRKGVLVDNVGDDWDATVVKVVANPIGLSEAMWSPYKRFGNMITEYVAKFASDKQTSLFDAAGKKIEQTATAATTAGAPPPAFDITKNVGMLAAVGIALGALGTAIGSIASAFFAMEWWQFPLVFLGLFILISGPAMLLAWLKLRQRTLGPLLEASGWAVNGRLDIDRVLSGQLTRTAELPANSSVEGSIVELGRIRSSNRRVLWLAVAAGVLAALMGISWWSHRQKVERRRAAVAAKEATVEEKEEETISEALKKLTQAMAPPPATAPAPAPATPPAAPSAPAAQ